MNLNLKLFVFMILFHGNLFPFTSLSAQVLCINCFYQNERVLSINSDLILNGGFENGCSNFGFICPNSTYYDCDISSWICTGGGSDTYASQISTIDMSLVVEGTKAVYFGNAFCDVCSTSQDTSCLEQIGCEVFGIPTGYPRNDPEYGGTEGVSLEQTVNGLIPGDNYELEFWAGGEEFTHLFLAKGLFAVDVGFGKIYLRDPTTPAIGGIGIRYVILFKAVSESTTIRFTNWGHMTYDATELIIDDVRLMKSNETGNPCSTSTWEVGAQNYIKIIPNPFHTTASIFMNNPEFQNVQLLIYNSNGILVRYMKLLEQSTVMERNYFPDGIYLFQLVVNNQCIQRGKFIID